MAFCFIRAYEAPARGPNSNWNPISRGQNSVENRSDALSLGLIAITGFTGHGEREYSYVQDTDFQRQQDEPNEVIRIRYDSLENLVAMGIVRRPGPRPPLASPFPASAPGEFVPDPPG